MRNFFRFLTHWSFLFMLVPLLGIAVFAVAPYTQYWLPKDISEHGRTIDHLFYFILWLTGLVFLGTEVVLFWFIWKYDAKHHSEPIKYTHGSHSLEVVWTILPAATLLFIAIYQMDAWAASKVRVPTVIENGVEKIKKPTAEVTGRQFEWRMRYPGPDGDLYTEDDLYDVNVLHVPQGEEVMLVIKSEDVLHSFFLPNLRIKQDVVPGLRQAVWFQANEPGNFDIVCAELCGWGHYKMKGQIVVEPRSDYEEFLDRLHREQNARTELASAE